MAISNVVESKLKGEFPIPWWRVVIGGGDVIKSTTLVVEPSNTSERGVYYVQCPTLEQAESLAEKRRYQNTRGPRQKSKRVRWKEAGLCMACGRVRDTDNLTCASCAAMQQRSMQKTRSRKVRVLEDQVASIEFAVLSEVFRVWRNQPNLKFDKWLMSELGKRTAHGRLTKDK